MALSYLYLMTRRLLGILVGSLRSEHAKDIEVAVLRPGGRHRHQRAASRPMMTGDEASVVGLFPHRETRT